MVVAQSGAADVSVLALVVVVAFIYLFVVRLIDLNEQEPLWAVATMFGVGLVAGTYLWLLGDPRTLELTVWAGPIVKEATRFAAIVVGVAILEGVGRLRGWSEINGVLDGLVYGVAAGLGMAVGAVFVRELTLAGGVFGLTRGPLDVLWPIALTGLSHGMYGAIIGIGFGVAISLHRGPARMVAPAVAFGLAVVVHVGHQLLTVGAGLQGTAAVTVRWIALLLPAGLVVVVAVYELAAERRTIRRELEDEAERGVVSADELVLLERFLRRRLTYLRLVATGQFDRWARLRDLHNRQVQLALEQRRLRRTTDAGERANLEAQIERLRLAILADKAGSALVPDEVAPSAAEGRP